MTRAMRSRRGAALLAALATIVVLSTITAVAARGARTTAAVVSNTRAAAIARAMAESGVLAAEARITQALASGGRDSLARQAAFDALLDERPSADGVTPPFVQDTLGDGAYAAALVNVSARFDVNSGDTEGLARLFSAVAPPAAARDAAARITQRLRALTPAPSSRDSLAAALLGRPITAPSAGAFETLDALATFLGDDAPWLGAVAPLLTVDGDGSIDRRHAPPAVLRAAAGALVDAPTRLLVIARGWAPGHPLTREIQAVFAVQGDELRLVRWRELTR